MVDCQGQTKYEYQGPLLEQGMVAVTYLSHQLHGERRAKSVDHEQESRFLSLTVCESAIAIEEKSTVRNTSVARQK